MKNNTFTLTLCITIGALACLFFLTDPFMVLMTTNMQMMLLLLATLLLATVVAFVLTEKAEDEREHQHRLEAGRVGYASGLTVLIVALVFQGLTHHIDIWISVAIAVMLLSKVGIRLYDSLRK